MDEGLLSIIPAGCGQLVKMLIALEPLLIFAFLFAHFPATGKQNGDEVAEHDFGRSRYFSGNAHNS